MKIKIVLSSVIFAGLLGSFVPTAFNAASEEGASITHYDTLPQESKDILKKSGWLEGPSKSDIAKAFLWLGGSLAARKYITTILKRDKQACQLKLQRQQVGQGAVNPMAQLLRALQMQQGGEGGMSGIPTEPELEAAEPIAEEELAWNPHDVLSPGKRKLLSVLSWAVTAVAVISVINVADRLKDAYRGNTVPSAVRSRINRHGEIDKKVADARKVITDNPGFALQIARELHKEYGLNSLRGVGGSDQEETMAKVLSARNEDATKVVRELDELR
ncbi:MAG: hypothetical protein QG632_762, partial [Candidatus Dependentiae bacterium]|nr:hypothetical protein [Candidatus Dependentiae bacterium]